MDSTYPVSYTHLDVYKRQHKELTILLNKKIGLNIETQKYTRPISRNILTDTELY